MNQFRIPEKVGFEPNHQIPNRDSLSALDVILRLKLQQTGISFYQFIFKSKNDPFPERKMLSNHVQMHANPIHTDKSLI